MSIIPVPMPMFYPSPYRFGGHRSDYGTHSAVRDLEHSGRRNHNELMRAVEKLGEQKLAITVIASEILPMVTAAFDRLDGPVRDYDTAYGKWWPRFHMITNKLIERKEGRKQRERDAMADKYVAENMEKAQREDARELAKRRSTWWSTYPFDKALAEVKAGKSGFKVLDVKSKELELRSKYGGDYFGISIQLERYNEERRPKTTEPKKPHGYESFREIKEVYEVASAAPNAMLTIPAETMRKIAEFAK